MKIITLVILILFQIISYADSNLKSFIKNEQGLCQAVVTKRKYKGRRSYLGGVQKNKAYHLYKNSLEEKYCNRLFPSSYKKVFKKGYDIPAELLDISVTNNLNNFQNDEESIFTNIYERSLDDDDIKVLAKLEISKINTEKLKQQFDSEEIIYLNNKAMNIWKDLISSYGHEEAKQFYYEMKLTDNEIQKIKLFKKELISFLKSTNIQNTWGINLFNSFHPFFTQTIIEALVTNFPTSRSSYAEKEKFRNRIEYMTFRNKGPNYFSVIESRNDKFKKYKKEEALFQEGKKFDSNEYTYQLRFSELENLSPGSFKLEELFVNSINLLEMNSEKNCAEWGLTPGVSRTILDKILFDSQSVNNVKYQFVQANILHKIKRACGGIKFELETRSFPKSIWLDRNSELFGEPTLTTYLTTSPIYRSGDKQSIKLYKYFKKVTSKWY